jgi:hypothetical protein
MARANLGDLLGKLPDAEAQHDQRSSHRDRTRRAEILAAAPEKEIALAKREAERSAQQSGEPTPAYLTFVRKDTRLREDQLERLTKEARRLNRAKRNTGVRITDNTLIRIAVDLLLARIEKASGDDEAAILRSLL